MYVYEGDEVYEIIRQDIISLLEKILDYMPVLSGFFIVYFLSDETYLKNGRNIP